MGMDAIDEAMRLARASNDTLRAALKDTTSMTDEEMARHAIEHIVDRALTPDAMAAELRRLGYGVTAPGERDALVRMVEAEIKNLDRLAEKMAVRPPWMSYDDWLTWFYRTWKFRCWIKSTVGNLRHAARPVTS